MSDERVKYRPIPKHKLEEMPYDQIMKQYNTMADWIQQVKGLNFRRNPEIDKDQLVDTILEAQCTYGQTMHMHALADALKEYGKTHPEPLFWKGAESPEPARG